jgi:chromosome segregation ATPase
LDTRQSELEALQAQVDDYSAQIGTLRSQLLTNTRSLERKDADGNRRIAELERQVNDKTGEVERLRSRMRMVENQNADQDLQLVSLKKDLEAKTEDFFQLNIALDAKQQELNMVRPVSLPLRCMIDLYE